MQDEVIIDIENPQESDDLISRDAVIERLKKENKILYTTTGLNYLIRVIEGLPPVTQKPIECDDAISRQNIIDTYKSCADMLSDEELKGADLVMEWVNNAQPVTPKSKTGHWITWKEAGNEIPSETRFECSVCHDAAQTLCNGLDLLSKYCPNCGARMVESQESEE